MQPFLVWNFRKKSGFTLVEMMVTIVIVTLLATAGLSAYTGYIKNVRDTQRIADITLLDSIVSDLRQRTGVYPTAENFESLISDSNNGQFITDPLNTQVACLSSANDTTLDYCSYLYNTCDNGNGYILRAKFETHHHAQKYTTLSNETGWHYHIGRCTTLDLPTPFTVISPELCTTKEDCIVESVCVGPPPKHCRPKNSQAVGAECDENQDCISNNCNVNARKCKN